MSEPVQARISGELVGEPRSPEAISVTRYEGPFGPMELTTHASGNEVTLTGAEVGRGRIPWSPHLRTSLVQQGVDHYVRYRQGLDVEVGDATVRVHQPRHGLLRPNRAVHVERAGRPARLRLRRLETTVLERTDGTALVQQRLGDQPVVHQEADAIDVAVFLLLRISGCGDAILG
ncbi:hypothetical protein BH20ACT2_BH20ACT2_23790 [soil metagenome]